MGRNRPDNIRRDIDECDLKMIEPIQIVIIVFALFAWSRAYLRFKDEKITSKEFIFWSLVWIVGIIIVMLPNTTFYLASLFGIKRGVDLIIYVSIVLLFYLVFRLYVKIETIEQDITKVVREIAISKGKKKR